MTRAPRFSAAALALFAASPVLADVTAKDVWEAWKAQATSMGQTLTVGSEAQSGDTLTVTGLVATYEAPTGKGSVTWGDMSFKDLGDGTVQVMIPGDFPMSFMGTDRDGAEVSGKIVMTSTGLNMIASGDPAAINYVLTADEMKVGLDSLTAAGTTTPMTVSFGLKGVSGTYKTTTGADFAFDADLKAASMDVNIDVTDPEGSGETVKLTGSATDIALLEKGKFPAGTNMQDMNAALKAGLDLTAHMTTGAASYALDVSGMEAFNGSFKATSSGFDFALANGGLKYQGGAKGLDIALNSAEMGLPVAAKMDEYVFGLTLPLLKTDASQDMGLVMKLVGLTVGEEIWSMFDPGKVLPRDPATLVIDVAGKGKWTADIMDPVAAAAITGTPVAMDSLNITELRLAAVGADVSATGALTFDNSMTAMGMPPMPLGAINVKALGVNALLDKFVQMGLIPQDGLMGMKMMMGMYAKPGAEPDSLESVIELKEGGQVFANGMPLQ